MWHCFLCIKGISFWIQDVAIQMKATVYWAVLSCGTVYYAVQGGSNFLVCEWNPISVIIQTKGTERYFPVVLFIMLYKVVLTF